MPAGHPYNTQHTTRLDHWFLDFVHYTVFQIEQQISVSKCKGEGTSVQLALPDDLGQPTIYV